MPQSRNVADNPYAAPLAADANGTVPASAGLKTLFWSIVAVFGASLLGGVLGAALGAALGAFLPGYYRSVMPRGHAPGFDPVAVGIGLGLSQGLVFGALIGLVVAAMFYWHRTLRSKSGGAGSI